MPNRTWFYAERGQQQGPFPDAQFRDLIARGIIRADTLVWTDGMAGWHKAGDIPGLFSSAGRPPTMPGRMSAATEGAGGALSIDLPLWPYFGRCVLLAVGNVLVIPSPWTATNYYQWIVPRFRVPGRPNLAFEGKVGDIWYVFILLALSAYVGRIHGSLQLLGFVGQAVLAWMLLRWVLSRLSANGQLLGLEFEGSVWAFIGWQLLMGLSVLTVVGWAWVSAAWLRWICRNISGSRRELTFNGSGLEMLWRTLVMVIGCVLLIPIPWVIRWYTQWIVSQLALIERGAYANA
jgi:hypothetical protein